MCVSGNPAMDHLLGGKYMYFVFFLFELLVYGKRVSNVCWSRIALWAVVFIVIFIGQKFTLPAISYLACLNYMVKVAVAIFAAYLLREKFAYAYLRIITFLSIFAIFLWMFNMLGICFPAFYHFENGTGSLIFYTQTESGANMELGFPRNAGMFWEAGAYGGYILFTFYLFINRLDYLWIKHRNECIILLIALTTTFSTTCYLILGVLVLLFFRHRVKNKIALVFISVLAIAGFLFIMNSLDFMGDKISGQYANAVDMQEGDYASSRFGAMVMDYYYIKLHPIFGNGLLNETRFSMHQHIDNFGTGNGFSGEIAYFGIPFMLFYLLSIYRNPTLREKWGLLLVVVLQLQGEYFMNFPMFFVLPFVVFFNIGVDNVTVQKKQKPQYA